MHYVIVGDPVPLCRPRIGYGARHMYDSQRERKLVTSIHIQNQHGQDPLVTGPIHLDVTFYLKLPAQLSKKKRRDRQNLFHYYKPDLSNLIKFIEDVAQNIIYPNDCQISIITSRKVYNDEPRTEFTIKELPTGAKYEEKSH